MATQVRADFLGDLRTALATQLEQMGAKVPASADSHEVCVLFYDAQQGRVRAAPRQVCQSAELEARVLADPVRKRVDQIAAASRAGEDLRAQSSTTPTLEDLGIFRLHLGPVSDRSLFATLGPDALHFIDVADPGATTDRQLLEIVHANWPSIIQWARIDFEGLGTPFASPNGGAPIELADGTMYMVAAPATARLRADELWHRTQRLEKSCKSNAPGLARFIVEETGRRVSTLELEMLIYQSELYALEQHSQVLIGLEHPRIAKILRR